MPLTRFFDEQFKLLREFMVDPGERVRVVWVDPELKEVLIKALARMQDRDDFAHVLLGCDESFADPSLWFGRLLGDLEAEIARHEALLRERGVDGDPARTGRPLPIDRRFLERASALAEALPDDVGSLVWILDPQDVVEDDLWSRTLAWLASEAHSRWLKFLVLEPRGQDRLRPLVESQGDTVGAQTFYLSPQEIEAQVEEDLARPDGLDPAERRRHLALAAGFAFGDGRLEQALELQREWVSLAEKDAEPGELASALYNRANTLAAMAEYESAQASYLKAGEVCLGSQLHQLLGLVLTNLGIVAYRCGELEASAESLEAARTTFAALQNRPGEAHALCCQATLSAERGDSQEAEARWRRALALYDEIGSDAMQDVRRGGREQVLEQLAHHFETTRQHGKLRDLEALRAGRNAT